ncbi:ornithine decarboxylase [Kiloniella spongiae]|uniref:ornithine decarboxylase n=1 Tax=Kiloniella spongiae TaxID=1489064 RepID=A0A0H2MFE9_9PROT|nr:type III PLP-dependent enzyme [Kiloniella spongiae]KLN60911.1 ornithine decarboxylase [Kiloniella spongiae]
MSIGTLTTKLDAFFAQNSFDEPHLAIDLDKVASNFKNLASALPEASIYYAVKANPEPQILSCLKDIGSCFDAASITEIKLCLSLGIPAKSISFGNTIKKQGDISQAFTLGIRSYAFDSEEELQKIASLAPGSDVYCRVLVDCAGADWPLSHKFGCSTTMARGLLLKSINLGLQPIGLSFHVGSQQTQISQWDNALEQIHDIYKDLKEQGIELSTLNLGGGFPTAYNAHVPSIAQYGGSLSAALEKHFGDNCPKIIIEPGRYIVGDAGVIEAEVVLVSRKNAEEEKRWVYLDIGIFSGLAECLDEAIKYPITVVGKEADTNLGPVILAGPSCDSVDVLYEKFNYQLPLDLKSGDKIRIHATGAYTTTYSSVGFNGFPPLSCSCI